MPDQPKTPQRAVRIPDDRWAATDRYAKLVESDRSRVINDLLAWWTHEPGARLPKRPAELTID